MKMKKLLSFSLAMIMLLSCVLSQVVFVSAQGNAVDYNDAPYAGVYAVISDVDTTVTTEIGSVTELSAGETGYMYLVKGANEVEITNGATLTVTDLDDNGLSYLDQVNIPAEPIITGQEDLWGWAGLGITLAPGQTYALEYTPSQGMNGMVYPYIAFATASEATLRVTSDTGFYADIYNPAGVSYSSRLTTDAAGNDIEMLYVREGVNNITLENISSNAISLYTIRFHSVGELVGHATWGSQLNVANLKPMTLAQINPTPEPTATPTPEPTPSVYTDTITYVAEDAGVYTVSSDVDVALKSELNSEVSLTAGEEGYIYLVKGKNIIETTDADAALTFTKLDNNGLDYIDQITVNELPFAPGDGHAHTAVNETLEPGDVYTIIFDTATDGNWNGMVYPYIHTVNDGVAGSFTIKADTGFYAELSKTGYSNNMYETVTGNGDIEYLYLRAGKNVISFENTGDNAFTIDSISFNNPGVLVDKNNQTWIDQSNVANLKPYTGDAPVYDFGYFPEGWDGTLENHPDYNAEAEELFLDGFAPNMSSDEGMELLGTDWGYTDDEGPVLDKDNEGAIYLPAGSYGTYTVNNIPNDGVYAILVRYGQASSQTASLQMINNVDGVDYYAQFDIAPYGSWSDAWSYNNGYDDFLYLQEGTNWLTVYNAGPGGIVFDAFDILALVDDTDYLQYVGTADNTAGTDPEGWTGSVVGWENWNTDINPWTYGVTQATGYDSLVYYPPYAEDGMNLSDNLWVNYTVTAPAAGMYLVDAEFTGSIHLETEAGDYVDCTATSAKLQYIYLAAGDNIITATGENGSVLTSASFYQLNNSDAYLEQGQNSNTVPEEPYDLTINPNKDLVEGEGYYYKYPYDATNFAVVQGAGSVLKYELNVLFPGIYRVQAKIGGTVTLDNLPVITIDTDANDGYRALLATEEVQDHGAVRATDSEGNYQYVYLKEGINHVEVTAGSIHHVLWNVEFKLLTPEEEATITIDDCKLTPPRPIVINPYTDSIIGTQDVDYHMIPGRVAEDKPSLGSTIGTQLITGEWQRFEVDAKVAGTYQIKTTAAVYDSPAKIVVETVDSYGYTNHDASPDNYFNKDGTYITLKEGVNSVWVRNEGPGWCYLQKITLTYVDDASQVAPGAFVLGQNYIGASEDPLQIPEYSVRNNLPGIHVANTNDSAANTLTYQYKVTIPADDYYGIVMTGTVPLTPTMTITLEDGVNEAIVMMDGEPPYFGNENEANSVTVTPEKVFLPAGEYTMTFTLTENQDSGTSFEMMTHVHGFEFTTLTRQDMFLAAMQSAETTQDIANVLAEFEDVITSEISLTPETDFIYPEYAYNALLNCAMLESGAYETYEDVKTAYDFAKNMISVADDGSGNLIYTVQVGDWNAVGTTVLVAVYTGENADQLYMMGDGYLDYTEATGSYHPVEATLYDYIPEDGDVIKVFIWDSFDGLKPVF